MYKIFFHYPEDYPARMIILDGNTPIITELFAIIFVKDLKKSDKVWIYSSVAEIVKIEYVPEDL